MEKFFTNSNFKQFYKFFTDDKCEFKKNDLFYFLNDPNNLDGQIILNTYEATKCLEIYRLVDLVILDACNKDKIHFHITPALFEKIKKDIIELFPTEDPDAYYVSYQSSTESSDRVGAHGALYTHFKYVKKRLLKARMVSTGVKNTVQSSSKDDNQFSTCLTDEHQEKYPIEDISDSWNKLYLERMKILMLPDSKKSEQIKKYLITFKCLDSDLGIKLLESDFNKKIDEIIEKDSSKKSIPYATLFCDNWHIYGEKLINLYKNSTKKEIKEFVKKYNTLLNEGNCSSILSLIALPLYISVTKSLKRKKDISGENPEEISITKLDIIDSFILHIKEEEEKDAVIERYENKLMQLGLPKLPYVVICGPIDKLSETFVVLNTRRFYFSNPLASIQACFKCLFALNIWPYMCDFLWIFIAKLVYRLDTKKSYISVTRLISEIKKKLNT